jgi:UDP-N-acetylglucosamine 1-carboxyvinyltransferase
MRGLGARIEDDGVNATIDAGQLNSYEASYEWVQRMRASVLIMGPLLARLGKVRISLPGGCAIGTRPINLHLKGFAAMGAQIENGSGFVEATAPRLTGGTVYLDIPSVGATENIMMAATLAEGTTRIENAAKEPEIVDLACFLNSMGARVRGAGDGTILIEGVKALHSTEYTPIPDRIEAGTMMILAAATGGNVLLRNVQAEHLRAVIAKLHEAGARVSEYPTGIRVRAGKLSATDIKTMVYPGFPTDLQAPMMAMLTGARGTSVVTENIFENRFMHVAELRRMGANIHLDDRVAVIEGVRALSGAHVIATDLRAGAALVVAAAVAEGVSVIDGVRHIDRGYECLEDKLRGIGANIRRTEPGDGLMPLLERPVGV